MSKVAGRSMRLLATALTVGGAGTLAAVVGGPGGVASADPQMAKPVPALSCTGPVQSTISNPIDKKQIMIADPECGFTPTLDSSGKAISTVYSGYLADSPAGGMANGGMSAYRVEVPTDWNGTVVMFAHGYAGTGDTVGVSNPTLRTYYIDHGYAWAASSYAMNGYDVGTGVVDTHDLLNAFHAITGKTPRHRIMSGLSMGGEITAVEVEYYRHTYEAAMPYCGVLGANNLFDYYLGANVTAAALTSTTIQYPSTLAAGLAYGLPPTGYGAAVTSELPTLGITPVTTKAGTFFTTSLTPTGKLWSDTVEQLSGGTRPGFASALSYWNSFGFAPLTNIPFLFGLYPGTTGGTIYYANGNIAGNQNTFYHFADQKFKNLQSELKLNLAALRVSRTVPFSSNPTTTELPDVVGDPGIPVLSLHGIGDLFVPLAMDQRYNQLMIAHGEGNLFVDRAIREVGHCSYTQSELQSGFQALVNWVNTGEKPAGDNILDPRVVSAPTFGCRFTDPTAGSHPNFRATSSCPPVSSGGEGGQSEHGK